MGNLIDRLRHLSMGLANEDEDTVLDAITRISRLESEVERIIIARKSWQSYDTLAENERLRALVGELEAEVNRLKDALSDQMAITGLDEPSARLIRKNMEQAE